MASANATLWQALGGQPNRPSNDTTGPAGPDGRRAELGAAVDPVAVAFDDPETRWWRRSFGGAASGQPPLAVVAPAGLRGRARGERALDVQLQGA